MKDAEKSLSPETTQATERPHSPPVLTRHRSTLLALTGLRFFAASYVIVFHTRLAGICDQRGLHALGRFFSNGYTAVTLFFMLSGFILAYNYREQVETRRQAFRFWEARFARIWPAYAFSLLCSSFPAKTVPTPGLMAATLAMVQAWNPLHPEYADAWNFVCWTLSVEAFFYLVFPLLQRGLDRLRQRSLVWALGALLLAGVLLDSTGHNDSARYGGIFWLIPAPVIHLPEFFTGMLLGNLFLLVTRLRLGATDRGEGILPEGGFALFRLPVLTGVGLIWSLTALTTAGAGWIGWAIPGYAMLLYGLATENTLLARFLSTRWLVLGGEISYAMYLLRTPLQAWLIAVPWLRASTVVNLLYLPLGLIPFSLFSFYVVEGPSRRALRRFFASLQKRAA